MRVHWERQKATPAAACGSAVRRVTAVAGAPTMAVSPGARRPAESMKLSARRAVLTRSFGLELVPGSVSAIVASLSLPGSGASATGLVEGRRGPCDGRANPQWAVRAPGRG